MLLQYHGYLCLLHVQLRTYRLRRRTSGCWRSAGLKPYIATTTKAHTMDIRAETKKYSRRRGSNCRVPLEKLSVLANGKSPFWNSMFDQVFNNTNLLQLPQLFAHTSSIYPVADRYVSLVCSLTMTVLNGDHQEGIWELISFSPNLHAAARKHDTLWLGFEDTHIYRPTSQLAITSQYKMRSQNIVVPSSNHASFENRDCGTRIESPASRFGFLYSISKCYFLNTIVKLLW